MAKVNKSYRKENQVEVTVAMPAAGSNPAPATTFWAVAFFLDVLVGFLLPAAKCMFVF